MADFLYRWNQMPGVQIDELFNIWAVSLHENAGQPPFANHDDVYGAIDAIPHGGEPWSLFSVSYSGNLPEGKAPPWMVTPYDVHFCDPRTVLQNQLSNPHFKDGIDYALLCEYGPKNKHIWSNFMGGNWAWSQADMIEKDPLTHVAMFVPCILGSDKMTVLVATGQNEYYPLYLFLGNVDNNICRSHQNAVSIIAFLSIPKTDRQYMDDPTFRKFSILELLRPGMTTPETLWDEYGIVGDVLPFTANFPRADIHELLTPDLLHQLIKGTFKDHLVTWVGEYLGRGFKQWTGDNLKALMKVYLPAIAGHVPPQMVCALAAFLDFCYLVRRDIIDESTLDAIDDALSQFHRDRVIFEQAGVRPDGFSLPHQHSMKHYQLLIQLFGAPNGLCSSITESKHIKAIKEPWRQSSHFEAVGQMLVTIQRLDQLAVAHVDFTVCGMLSTPLYAPHLLPLPPDILMVVPCGDVDNDDGAANGSKVDAAVSLARTQVCPTIPRHISVFHSAKATYYAPSNHSGIARHDCIFVVKDQTIPGICGLYVAKVHSATLVEWFVTVGEAPCDSTGMWIVKPDVDEDGFRTSDVIHTDCILWGAHLIGMYGDRFVPWGFKHTDSLATFEEFYVSKHADHHMNEIVY
ncbi:hypothetical protein BYT27DRAFT_7224251 [Phlegmacium glaucopus]|nr:hypothetical protein BYT27DRAFT_7224251 [Phlegmacium glaucopus]